jgi:hypothetical protein
MSLIDNSQLRTVERKQRPRRARTGDARGHGGDPRRGFPAWARRPLPRRVIAEAESPEPISLSPPSCVPS